MLDQLAFKLAGLTVPLLALIAFLIPLLEKLTGSRDAPRILTLLGSLIAVFHL